MTVDCSDHANGRSVVRFEDEIRIMHGLIRPLLTFDRRRFLMDLLVTSLLAWSIAVAAYLAASEYATLFLCLIGGCVFYRAATMIHDISHFQKELEKEAFIWNLLVGVPFLIPSFMYVNQHLQHHSVARYTSDEDAEYEQYAGRGVGIVLLRLMKCPLLPLFAPVRFLFLAPVGLMSRRIGGIVRMHFSTLSLKIPFKRSVLPDGEIRTWVVLEAITWAYCLIFSGALWCSILSWKALAILYSYVAIGETLNVIRALGGTHGYRHSPARIGFRSQIEDSFNIESRSMLHRILFPNGLQYHALHHLFPRIPYYRMREAHTLLMEQLPRGSFYRALSLPTIWRGFKRVLDSRR